MPAEKEFKRYKIVRFYANQEREELEDFFGITLEEAQKHCKDPETSSRTCKDPKNTTRTDNYGPWFDGYEEIK
jgi:hypothetical protein